MARTGPQPRFGEFVTLTALIVSLVALSIDIMLPALQQIGGELGAPRANDSQFRYIITVAAATYFFWISLYLYVPVLPLHARELGANLEMIGIIIASYAIGQILLRIPVGVGSDIIGRKPFAVGAALLAALRPRMTLPVTIPTVAIGPIGAT